MTSPVRSHKPVAVVSWRAQPFPDAANDTARGLPALSRSLPKDPEELAQLRDTLQLREPADLRAAAMLVMLGLGLHKRELVALDVSDIVTVGSVVCVTVKSRARRDPRKRTFLPVLGDDARVVTAYLEQQHDEAAALTAPLFYSIEHGRADRLARASAHSVSYWLLELRLRARSGHGRRRAARRSARPAPP